MYALWCKSPPGGVRTNALFLWVCSRRDVGEDGKGKGSGMGGRCGGGGEFGSGD